MSCFVALTARAVQAAASPSSRRFLRALEDPRQTQSRLLRLLVHDAARTAYGRTHGLLPKDGLAEFQRKIPIVSYQDLRPWIERSLAGEPSVLSPHPLRRVEHTAGSGGTLKTIPYNRPILRSFSRMFTLWAHDLLRRRYRPVTGRLFLCVTAGRPEGPRANKRWVADDRDYLSPLWNVLLHRFVAAPDFDATSETEDPLDRLAHALAQEPQLELLSFWSPSLLLAALDHLSVENSSDTARLWPRLQIISCWTAGSSARFIERLTRLFPNAAIQGKGLIATEAPITFPMEDAGGCVPLVTEVFLEFLSGEGEIVLLDQLDSRREYELLLSTRGGLLRYRLGDRVAVAGRFRGCPLLEFTGRAGIVSDLVGEKISAAFVERELAPALTGYFCLLPGNGRYELWLEDGSSAIAAQVEAILFRNPHYARARLLGQLQPLRVRTAQRLAEKVAAALSSSPDPSSGPRPGDIKPPLLLHRIEWAERLRHADGHRPPVHKE
ncbi:MAG TPA: GH3 auxin-responsive promoter family protein [Verrucomicrobiales bacterium]|nr:GH3 auxin-responsive promoter family protein [Verrucomicrobiales bacterium]